MRAKVIGIGVCAFALGFAVAAPIQSYLWPRIVMRLWPSQGPAPNVEDATDRPNVLIIGDSISIDYTEPVRKLLVGQFDVFRIPGNGSHTRHILGNIDGWLAGHRWDVIYFNAGLHDLRDVDGGGNLTPLPEYANNLSSIADHLIATGADVIFATTTAVPVGAAGRQAGAEVAYNDAAVVVMRSKGVCVDDLGGKIAPWLAAAQMHANVHFTPEGSWLLAREVAATIRSGC